VKKILIDSHGAYIRAALAEDGRLLDLIVDKKSGRSITGNVYLGIVKNILPNQFAFIDIGQPKNGFLNSTEHSHRHPLRMGQSVLVQVRKDPSGDKGASLSRKIDIAGRLVVLSGNGSGEIGVSHKIKGGEERERLRSVVHNRAPKGLGVILRTGSENKGADEILEDLDKQISLYRNITAKGYYQKPPALIYQENSLLHDFLSENIDEIIVGEPSLLSIAAREAEKYLPDASVRLHTDKSPLFGSEIESQIDRALDKKIWLDCGGFLIIEQTEACVIIDVNTGKFTGQKSHRESILKTNLEAAAEAAAQIRLRNLSGMIIIDFINMEYKEDTRKLYGFLTEAISRDRIKTNIIGITELGLMQLTRKKTRETLSRILLKQCPHCHGSGYVKTDWNS
jgi:ribonuclease G